MSNCIRNMILFIYVLGHTGVNENICQFFASQKLVKILRFPIFGGSCIKIVSSEQNFINWHICQWQTHLLLLKDKEKFLLKLLGKNWIVIKRLSSQLSGFLWNFAFLSQQNNIVFFILLVHYQQASMQLVSAFRHRRQRVCLNRAHFRNHP